VVRLGTVSLPDPFQRTRKDPDMELEFRNLSSEDKDALATFFKDSAKGMLKCWDYEDNNGIRRVRFNEPALVFVQHAADSWDTRILLIIE